jgi:WD40 repeat protein
MWEFARREIGIWSLTSGRWLALISRVPETALVAWRPDGRQLATDFGPAVQLWDVSDPQHPRLTASVKKFRGVPRPDYLLYSPDGRQLVTAESADARITDIDVRAQHIAWTFQVPDLRLGQVAISPDGRTVAVDSGDNGQGHITVLDSTSGRRERSVAVASIGEIGYLNGGRWLVATGLTPVPGAQLYDLQTLQAIGIPFPIKSVLGVGPLPGGLATDPAGRMFAEPENDAPLLWQASPAQWEKLACRIAGRNLTRAEWHQYLPTLPYERVCPEWPAGLPG